MKWLMLAVGSVVGGFGRYALSAAAQRLSSGGFPMGTLVVNVAGCFAIGLLNGWASSKGALSPEARLLAITGFCGAFTTFSAFTLDTVTLSRAGQTTSAVLNIVLTVTLCLVAFLLADKLMMRLSPFRT